MTRNYIARLNTYGTVDSTFNPNANSSVHAIALQPDGKILLAGDFCALAPNGGGSINRLRIARLNTDGTVDLTFDPSANASVLALAVQADGDIVWGLAGNDRLSSAFNRTALIGGSSNDTLTTNVVVPLQGEAPV